MTTSPLKPGHDQSGHRVRMEWGPVGAAAITRAGDVAVVVDVLSFTTTLSVAVERGIEVWPHRWRDARAAAYAEQHGALLAVGRLEAREQAGQVSLSPAAMQQVEGVERIVLPSPNGSTIAAALVDSGAAVAGGCLRNATAVAHWAAGQARQGGAICVIPAGERWPDDTLRPCAEDLWGAGAVIAALEEHGIGDLSPEARLASTAWRGVRGRITEELAGCAGGVELAAAGFGDDVAVAAQVDATATVPVLTGGAFTAHTG